MKRLLKSLTENFESHHMNVKTSWFYWTNLSVGTLIFFTSCSNSGLIHRSRLLNQSIYCAPTIAYTYSKTYLPVNADSLVRANSALGNVLSEHDMLMANATGILPLIQKLVIVHGDTSVTGRLSAAGIVARIQNRLLLASSEIDGVVAELDCEGERADQLANYLDGLNRKRNNRLTATSIIIGAAVVVATAAVSGDHAQNAVGISGGLVAAGLGVLLLDTSGKGIKMDYSGRNVLSDIWFVPASSTMYPPFIWYMLNEKRFSNSRELSLIQSIKERWVGFEFEGTVHPERVNLFFRQGGIYDAAALHTRASLLNQLQSTIRSVHQDMQSLTMAVEKFTITGEQ